jgi:hypothetical protein
MSGAFVQGTDRMVIDGDVRLSGAFRIAASPDGQLLDLRAGAGSDGTVANHGPTHSAAGSDPVTLAALAGDLPSLRISDIDFTGRGLGQFDSLYTGDIQATGLVDLPAGVNIGGALVWGGASGSFLNGLPGGSSVVPNLNADYLNGYHASGLGRLDQAGTWTQSQIFNAAASFQASPVPFVVVGTDQVDNLNANYLQGFDAAHFADADNLSAGTVGLPQGGTNADNSSQAINLVFATPASGGAGAMSIRALVAADIPSLDAAKVTTGQLALARGGTAVDGSSQLQNRVLASPDGSTGALSIRALVAADIPSLAASKITSGAFAVARGGTGLSTIAANSLLYTSALDTVAVLPVGAAGTVLKGGTSPSFAVLLDTEIPSLDAAKITTGAFAQARQNAQTMYLDAASQTLVNGLTVGGALAASTTLAVTSRAGIGGASATDTSLKVTGTTMTGTSQYGAFVNPTFSAAASSLAAAAYLRITTAASLTMPSLRSLYVEAPSIGASNSIGQVMGIHIAGFSTTSTGTNTGLLIGNVSGGATSNFAISTGTGIAKFGDEVNIIGALNHDGANAGFRGLAPVALPAAVTQTYSTADRTHAARTAAALTDSTAGTVGTTLAALPNPADTPATADALRDDIVLNVLPVIRNWVASLADQINKGRADCLDTAQLVNVIVDDLQLQGLEG